MGTDLAKMDVGQLMQLGGVFAKSGFFADARQEAQAVVKILAGAEMGFSPIASMMGVYVISGRVSVGANLMAAAVKKSGKYDYRVLQMDESACEIEYFQGDKPIGKSKFTIADARKAQTKNLDKFPRNMLFARAMSNGVRWYCPDALGGATIYTPEEMGAETDEEGNVIGGVVVEVQTVPAPQPTPTTAVSTTQITPKSMPKMKPSTWELLNALGLKRFGDEWEKGDRQKKVAAYVSDNQTDDIMSLLESEAQAAIEEIEKKLAEMKAAAEAEPAPA